MWCWTQALGISIIELFMLALLTKSVHVFFGCLVQLRNACHRFRRTSQPQSNFRSCFELSFIPLPFSLFLPLFSQFSARHMGTPRNFLLVFSTSGRLLPALATFMAATLLSIFSVAPCHPLLPLFLLLLSLSRYFAPLSCFFCSLACS